MSAFLPIDPEELGRPAGFSHGMLAREGGRFLFVAGQPAMGPDGAVIDGGFAEQFAVALDRVLAVVAEAGGGPHSVGRLTVYVTDMAAYLASRRELGRIWRERMGSHYPAMALVEVTRLVDQGAIVELEATAVIS
ncbi:MAG: RidA family protein [Gemmatimonadota bacterium]